MQCTTVEPRRVVYQIACDRCGKDTERGTPAFHTMTSICFDAGYDSLFGDGNRVSIDLCEACLRDTLGSWLRVTPTDEAPLSHELEAFNPELHGGEFPASPSGNREDGGARAQSEQDHLIAKIDELIRLVRRIAPE